MVKHTKPRTAKRSPSRYSLLVDGQVVKIDNCRMKLIRRDTRRLVICFLDAEVDTNWIDGTCKEAGLSQLRILAPTLDGFAGRKLQTALKSLATGNLVKDFAQISLCGSLDGGGAVLTFGGLFKGATLVAFDPTPVAKPSKSDPLVAAGKSCRSAYIFHDPFTQKQRGHQGRLFGSHIHWLGCFGMQERCLHALWRMKVLQTFLNAALRDELDPSFFYSRIRLRKDYYFYRKGIEGILIAKKQPDRLRLFRRLFRERREQANPEAQFAALKAKAERRRLAQPGAWVSVGASSHDPAANWPSVGGNVWMLERDGGRLRYLSDRWQHVTMGYEERGGVTLAQTPPVALGMVGFGHGIQVERPLPRRFRWHVTDENLNGTTPAFGPMAEATLMAEHRYENGDVLHSTLAISQAQPGIVSADAEPGADAYQAVLSRIQTGCENLKVWNKSLFVDRIRLGLLAGAPQTDQRAAAEHFANTAANLTHDVTALTTQTAPPIIVMVQSAGGREAGCSEVILAEGRFDLDNPTLPAIVATPAYPWPLMEGTPATHSHQASLIMDELCAIAVSERQQGRAWHCPALQLAKVAGKTIIAEFSSMSGLQLGDGPHGFRVEMEANAPRIVKVDVISDRAVRIECDSDITGGEGYLCYAYGHVTPGDVGAHTANHGALRDTWRQASIVVPGQILRRFALAGRIPLIFGS